MKAGFIVAGVATVALVAAQYVVPEYVGFHGWPYALALTACACVVALLGLGRARSRSRNLSVLGAGLVVASGLWSGIAGPDEVHARGAAGTSLALDAATRVEFKTDRTLLVGRGNDVVSLGNTKRKLWGDAVLRSLPRPVATIVASNSRGERLTITQPSGSTFLSPVLLFRETQRIAGEDHPFDRFAIPARNASFTAVLFNREQVAKLQSRGTLRDQAALVYAEFDAHGHSGGIAIASSGQQLAFAGILLRATIGEYPELAIDAVPPPPIFAIGCLVMLIGIAVEERRIKSRSRS